MTSQSLKMAASMKVGFQIFKLQYFSYLLVDFDQTRIKIFCFESSILIDIPSSFIAFPFKKITFYMGDNFFYFLLGFRYTMPPLKRVLS